MIIDAHAHVMSEVKGRTGAGATRSLPYGKVRWGDHEIIQFMPPAGTPATFPPDVLVEHMKWAGVDRAVLLQGPFYGEANEYIWRAVQRWPDRFIGAGYVDPHAPDARAALRRVVDDFGFHVLKFEMSTSTGLVGLYPDLRLDDEEMAWLWEEAHQRGLVITLDLGAVGSASYQTEAVRDIADRYGGLKIVVAHLAQPPMGKEGDEQFDRLWRDQVLLARHPRIWLDLAALPAYAAAAGDDYPYPTALRYIRRAVEMVGASKLLWGTDVPGLLSHATYPQLVGFVARHCDFLTQSEREAVLGGTAAQVYGLGVGT